MPGSDLSDCFNYGGALLRHHEAMALLKSRLGVIAAHSDVAVGQALGRILAGRVVAQRAVPPHTNAAVDGFALRRSDCDPNSGGRLSVIGRSAAGAPFDGAVPVGAAIRILTGAVVPPELDVVAMQEDCRTEGNGEDVFVNVPGGLKRGANIRKAGEDVAAGAELLRAGDILRPQDLAAIASANVGRVACFDPLKVGIVSTGDEIVEPGGGQVAGWQVFDTNRAMLEGLAGLAGSATMDAGIWPDNRDHVIARLGALAAECDIVLTSGGASGGDEDHMAAALGALGNCHFWRLAIKPGRPLMLGQIGRTVVVGLPGNPVAVFVCFLVYVWPMLRVLSGAGWREGPRMPAAAAFSFRGRKLGRREFWRGILSFEGGCIAVDKFARDGSGLVSGLRAANCLIEIPEDVGDILEGDTVQVLPFAAFGIPEI